MEDSIKFVSIVGDMNTKWMGARRCLVMQWKCAVKDGYGLPKPPRGRWGIVDQNNPKQEILANQNEKDLIGTKSLGEKLKEGVVAMTREDYVINSDASTVMIHKSFSPSPAAASRHRRTGAGNWHCSFVAATTTTSASCHCSVPPSAVPPSAFSRRDPALFFSVLWVPSSKVVWLSFGQVLTVISQK
ncbi:uncharacterized protein DS421_17g581690 [Arachis hypogaea]|nr:uncharacterized protein DS421_17g581690 [Arachis hypogaea]